MDLLEYGWLLYNSSKNFLQLAARQLLSGQPSQYGKGMRYGPISITYKITPAESLFSSQPGGPLFWPYPRKQPGWGSQTLNCLLYIINILPVFYWALTEPWKIKINFLGWAHGQASPEVGANRQFRRQAEPRRILQLWLRGKVMRLKKSAPKLLLFMSEPQSNELSIEDSLS